MLTDFTLIIPTRNRHAYIPRGIEYYGNSGITTIIIDSSPEKYAGDIPFANIRYLHMPGYSFVPKIAEVLKNINTPCTGMCADDDFILPSSIESCVNFLKNNPSYASAQGNYMVYRRTGKNNLVLSPLLHPYQWEINAEKPAQRLTQLAEKYFHLYYAVHRTESFKEIFTSFDNSIKSLNLFELHLGCVAVINGKHKSLPVLYNVRETIIGSTGQTAGNVSQMLTTDTQLKTIFFQSIAKKLAEKEGISMPQAMEHCEKVLNTYAARIKKPSPVQKIINAVLPYSKRHWLKYAKIKMKHGSIDNYNKKITKNRQGYPFNDAQYASEMEKIKSIVLKHVIS
ncbi:MAG: TIGR00180 family glycosyltransferase [Flavobacteriales bacterium]